MEEPTIVPDPAIRERDMHILRENSWLTIADTSVSLNITVDLNYLTVTACTTGHEANGELGELRVNLNEALMRQLELEKESLG